MANAGTTSSADKSVRELTLAEVATSPRILVVIAVLLVVAVATLIVFFIRPGDDSSPRGGGGRGCTKSAAYSCEDFQQPPGGG